MIETRALSKRYGETQALDRLDLRIRGGEIFCLLGANGAGKTTTINLLLGFVAPTEGQALVDGIDVARDPLGARRRIAYIPETVMLYANLTGIENLSYFASLALGERIEEPALVALLDEAGLPAEAARRRVGGYSKGMRQKVGVAIALAKGAGALLLDEPTSGLDPRAASEFAALLERLKVRGVAILMATHDLFLARRTGTRVGIMQRGRLLSTLDPAELAPADLERVYLDLSDARRVA